MQHPGWAMAALILSSLPASAADGVAARVNGQPIPEATVQRASSACRPTSRNRGKEILNHLIDTALVDEYILQLPQFTASKEEIDKKEEVVRSELTQQKKDFNAWLQEMKLTEPELRQEIAADLRWNKYCDSEATDAKLRQLFDSDVNLFNGAMVPVPTFC